MAESENDQISLDELFAAVGVSAPSPAKQEAKPAKPSSDDHATTENDLLSALGLPHLGASAPSQPKEEPPSAEAQPKAEDARLDRARQWKEELAQAEALHEQAERAAEGVEASGISTVDAPVAHTSVSALPTLSSSTIQPFGPGSSPRPQIGVLEPAQRPSAVVSPVPGTPQSGQGQQVPQGQAPQPQMPQQPRQPIPWQGQPIQPQPGAWPVGQMPQMAQGQPVAGQAMQSQPAFGQVAEQAQATMPVQPGAQPSPAQPASQQPQAEQLPALEPSSAQEQAQPEIPEQPAEQQPAVQTQPIQQQPAPISQGAFPQEMAEPRSQAAEPVRPMDQGQPAQGPIQQQPFPAPMPQQPSQGPAQPNMPAQPAQPLPDLASGMPLAPIAPIPPSFEETSVEQQEALEELERETRSSKMAHVVGGILIAIAAVCVAVAICLLTGIIDLSMLNPNASQATTQLSGQATPSATSGSKSDEVMKTDPASTAGQVVYAYVVRGVDGGTHEAVETATFGDDGILESSLLEIQAASIEDAEQLLEQLRTEYGESLKEGTASPDKVVCTVVLPRDDLDRELYTELLSTNASEFKIISE